MTLNKTELRAAGMHDVGARIDDELEKARALSNAATGAVSALETAVKDIGDLVPKIQHRIDLGEMTMEDGRQQINGIEKAKNALLNLVAHGRKNSARLEGVAQGLRQAVEATSKLHGQEVAKKGRRQEEDVPQSHSAPPTRETIKQRRLREEAEANPVAKKKAKKKAAKKKVTKKKV